MCVFSFNFILFLITADSIFNVCFPCTRENGSLVHFHHIQDAEETNIPRSILEDNTKYLLTVTAYNHFGASPSDPFILSVKDVGMPSNTFINKCVYASV